MKHKVAELEGAQLDAAVALAEGHVLRGGWWRQAARPDTDWCAVAYFDPSVRWQVGGPIIDRERFEFMSNGGSWFAGEHLERWRVDAMAEPGSPTHLIAAMRAYVASKFGDEVELP